MNFKRNNDLTEVFDQRWRANHGNNERVQQAKADFNFKMFGIKDKNMIKKDMREANSVRGQDNSLNQRVNAMKQFNRNNFR